MPAYPVRTARSDPATLLNRGLAVLSAAHLLVLAAAALAALHAGLPRPWVRLAQVAAAMALNLTLLWLGRRRFLAGENLDRIWGPANQMTAARGVLAALLAGFLFAPVPAGPAAWVPASLYTALVCLDFADGWWARRSGSRTLMGAILDQEYDAFGILVAFVLVIQQARLPVVFAAVAVARYLFVLGLAARRRRGLPVHELPSSYLRRRLAGFQMGILAVFLWPMASPPATTLAEAIIGVPLLAGFLRDWLLATGRLAPANPRYLAAKRLLYRLARQILAPLARLLLASVAALAVWELWRGGYLPTPFPPAGGLLPPLVASGAWALLRPVLAGTLAAGHFVAPTALALLLLEGARAFVAGLDAQGAAVISAALLLYLFGAGPGRLADLAHAVTRVAARRARAAARRARAAARAALARRAPAVRPKLLRHLLWLPVPPLLYWALRDLRVRELSAVLGGLGAAELAALLALNLLFLAGLTGRWWLILRGLGARLPFRAAAAYRLAGFAVSYLTPGPQTGGEPVQVYLASRRWGLSYAAGSASVLLDKSYELLGNFFFLAVGVLTVAGLGVLPAGRATVLLLAPLAFILPPALYLAALLRGGRPLSALLVAVVRRRPRLRGRLAARRLLQGVSRSERLLVGYAQNRARLAGQLGCSFLVVWGISVLEMFLVLRFLGMRMDLVRTVFVLTAGRLAFLLPLPGAFGALELTQVAAFALLGYGPEAALSLVLYVRARDLLFAAAGVLITLSGVRRAAKVGEPPAAPRD